MLPVLGGRGANARSVNSCSAEIALCGAKAAADSGLKHFQSTRRSLLANHRQQIAAELPTPLGRKHKSMPPGLLKGDDLSQEILRGLDQFSCHLLEEI